MEYTKEQSRVWLKEQLKDLVADKKHIDESDMPLFNQGLDWVCALETKAEKILDRLSAPDLYEACNSFICNIGFVKISDGKSKALLNVLRAEIQRAIAKAEINL